jgi:hypothetical protein
VDKNKIFCEGVGSGERVCVNEKVVYPEKKKKWALADDVNNPVRFIIVMNNAGEEVYFKSICAGTQGKFDGEILYTSDLQDAAKYTTVNMIHAQLGSVEFSLKKNPNLSNPCIKTIVFQSVC